MVEFKTKFNFELEKIMKQENVRKAKKFLAWFSGVIIALGVMFLMLAVSDYYEGLKNDAVGDLYYGIFLIVFGGLFYPLMVLLINKSQKKEMQSFSLVSEETEEVYKFDEEKIFIFTTKGEDYRSAVETNYKYINNIVKTKDYYVLYISKIQCHVLKKEDIVSGSVEELNKIFETHFSKEKYKKVVK